MAYSLNDFCTDLSAILTQKGVDGLPQIAAKLSDLIKNPAFVAETFQDDTPFGKRELWRDPQTDARVLAHVQEPRDSGKPHTHGHSWAIYGTVRGVTDMTDYRRITPATPVASKFEAVRKYSLGPAETQPYPPGAIHSTARPGKTWLIRITGCDLDAIPGYGANAAQEKVGETA